MKVRIKQRCYICQTDEAWLLKVHEQTWYSQRKTVNLKMDQNE